MFGVLILVFVGLVALWYALNSNGKPTPTPEPDNANEDSGGVDEGSGGVNEDSGRVNENSGGVNEDSGGVNEDSGGVNENLGGDDELWEVENGCEPSTWSPWSEYCSQNMMSIGTDTRSRSVPTSCDVGIQLPRPVMDRSTPLGSTIKIYFAPEFAQKMAERYYLFVYLARDEGVLIDKRVTPKYMRWTKPYFYTTFENPRLDIPGSPQISTTPEFPYPYWNLHDGSTYDFELYMTNDYIEIGNLDNGTYNLSVSDVYVKTNDGYISHREGESWVNQLNMQERGDLGPYMLDDHAPDSFVDLDTTTQSEYSVPYTFEVSDGVYTPAISNMPLSQMMMLAKDPSNVTLTTPYVTDFTVTNDVIVQKRPCRKCFPATWDSGSCTRNEDIWDDVHWEGTNTDSATWVPGEQICILPAEHIVSANMNPGHALGAHSCER